jgi:hypothetical protein
LPVERVLCRFLRPAVDGVQTSTPPTKRGNGAANNTNNNTFIVGNILL